MSIRRYAVIFTCTLFPLIAIAQNDSLPIGQQILNYPFTRDDYVLKGRRMLADRFEQMDWNTVKQIMDYFEKEVDKLDYVSLWPGEKILLYYWTQQYDQLLGYKPAPDVDRRQYNYSPLDPRLGELVVKWSVNDFDLLNNWIDESAKNTEEKTFLKLLLEMMLADDLSPRISQEQINRKADAFIQQYPYSKYVDFTKKNISTKTELSDWGYGVGFSGGYTFHNNDYLNPKGCISMDANVRYKRLMLDIMIQAGFGKLQENIPDTEWYKGDDASPICVGLSLGYSVVDQYKFRITPFAGVSFNTVTPNEELRDEYPSLKDVSLKGFSALVGIRGDWKFLTSQNRYNAHAPATIYALCLNVFFLPGAFNNAGQIYEGNMLFVTAGFSFDWYRTKRAY